MPKTNFCQPRVDPVKAKSKRLAYWIKRLKLERGMTSGELAKRTGMKPDTLNYRLANPETFRWFEVLGIMAVLKAPEEYKEDVL